MAEDKARDRRESLDSGRKRNAVFRSQGPDADRMDFFNGLLVFCPGNKLPEFGRRVARLARRQSAGDLARSASEGNAGRRDESAEEW